MDRRVLILNADYSHVMVSTVQRAFILMYLNKTECFCFNQQELAAGETAKLPLRFIVDLDVPKQVHTITLSYTLFDVTERFSQTQKLVSKR